MCNFLAIPIIKCYICDMVYMILLKRKSEKFSHFCIFKLLLVIVTFVGFWSPLVKHFSFLAWSTLYLEHWKYFLIVSFLYFLWSTVDNITSFSRAFYFLNLSWVSLSFFENNVFPTINSVTLFFLIWNFSWAEVTGSSSRWLIFVSSVFIVHVIDT